MHTSTFGQFLVGALVASSAVGFQFSTYFKLGSVVALALPAHAAPVLEQAAAGLETRHHKGKRVRKNNKREELVEIEARHHKGKRTGTGPRDVVEVEVRSDELQARHHKGKRTRKNNKRQNGNLTDSDGLSTDGGINSDNGFTSGGLSDSDIGGQASLARRHHKGKRTGTGPRDVVELESRSDELEARHHKGKRTRKNNKRQNGNLTDSDGGITNDDGFTSGGVTDGFASDSDAGRAAPRAPTLSRRHHKGKRTRKNNKRDVHTAVEEDEDVDDEAHEVVKRHHKGKRTRKNNKRDDFDGDDADTEEDADHEDEAEEALEKRHHKGKRIRGGNAN